MTGLPDRALLRNRDFAAFTGSHTVCQFADKVHHRALIFLVGVLAANSPGAYSVLVVAMTLPVLLLAPVAGVCVDRWSRRRVMVFGDLLRAALVLAIPTAVWTTRSLGVVYPLVFGVFTVTLLHNTAKLSLLPDLVEGRQLVAANSIGTLASQAANILGFVSADFLVAGARGMASPGAMCFGLVGLAFLISAGLLSRIDPRGERQRRHSAESCPTGVLDRRVLQEFRQGLTAASAGGKVRLVMGSIVLFTLLGSTVYVCGVPIVQGEVASGTFSVGTLGAISALGMIAGALAFGTLGRRWRRTTVLGLGYLGLGTAMVVLSGLHSFGPACAVIAFSGALVAPMVISHDAILQEELEGAVRGRVFGAREWLFNGCFLGFAAVIGWIAEATSARTTLGAVGWVIIVVAAAALFVRQAPPRR